MKYVYILIYFLFYTVLGYGGNLQVTPGQLQELVYQNELQYQNDLTLTGSINGTDIKFLRGWLTGSRSLNLANCRIVAGGDAYYGDYKTEDDVIGDSMFCNNELRSLILPKTLKRIGNYALGFCGETIDFPATLTWIGDHAFTKNKFSKLHIPATLIHIGNGAFNGNGRLELTIDENNPEFIMEDDFLYTQDHTRLLGYYGKGTADELRLAQEVKIIDDKAFNTHRAYSVILNDGLESIGEEAFNWVLNILPQKKLIIPNSVTYIGARAFDQCRIDTLIISDNVERIEPETFYSANSKYLHLPNKLKSIGHHAFENCRLKEDERLPESLETIEEFGFDNLHCSKLVIPKNLRNIAKCAFNGISVDTLDIQAELEVIPNGAFYYCQTLKKLILPSTIKRIEGAAFYACYALDDCHLPEGLEVIGTVALAGADYMKEWHIPASIREIGFGAFQVPNFSAHNLYMYSQTPPAETDPMAFDCWKMELSVLYVPKGCIQNYKNMAPWCYFSAIREFDTTDIKSIQNKKYISQSETHFNIDGRSIYSSAKGLHVIRRQNGQIHKVVVQ